MKIYFGSTLIDEDYYISIENEHTIFKDEFKLGGTASNSFEIEIGKEAVSTQPTTITIKDASNNNLAILNVDEIVENDYSYKYSCTDAMTKLDYYYDASDIFVSGSTTLLAIVQDICSDANITLGTNNFRGYDKTITWYDNTKTARDYIGYVAELNGGYAYIENNILYFKKINTSSVKTIDLDDCSDYEIGAYHKITRVVYELGTLKYEFGDTTGDTLYLNGENVYITTESEVQSIYNEIKDFEYYTFEVPNCPIDYSVKAGQIITFSDGTNDYKTIANIDLSYYGGWLGGYKLDVVSSEVQETQVISTEERIKNINIKIDRENNEILEEVRENDTEVKATLTSTNAKLDIVSTNIDTTNGNIKSVTTTSGFTFDANGLSISSSKNKLNTLIDNEGTYYKDGETILGQTTKDGSNFKNMELFGEFRYGKDDLTDNALFVGMKYNDGTEDCFGHFYNGDD